MVFAPFLLLYVAFCLFLLIGLFVLIELEVISYAFGCSVSLRGSRFLRCY
jgi:hypothetical protein